MHLPTACNRPCLHLMATIILTLSMVFFCLPQQGWATKVYSPIVSGGELELEFQNDFILDADPVKNGTSKHQLELAYAVTDRWQMGLYGVFEKKPGQSLSYTQTKWANVFQVFEQGEHWVDTGLYLEYIKPAAAQQKPDVLECKLLLETPVGASVHTLNIIVVKPLGQTTQGTTWEYAWRSLWKINPDFQPAIEAYGAMGRIGTISTPSGQNHLLGPVIRGKMFDDFKYDVGYLFGLTKGSVNGLIKLNFDYEF